MTGRLALVFRSQQIGPFVLKMALLCLLTLLLVRAARLGRVADADVYVWQRHWSSALAQAVRADAGLFRKWHVLTAEISAGNQAFRTQANWAELGAAGHEVVPYLSPARALHLAFGNVP